MDELQKLTKKLDIQDKKTIYEHARELAIKYAKHADELEILAQVNRQRANKFAERQNAALKALNDAMK